MLIALADKYVVPILDIGGLFLYPLQGFFSALIYSIPQIQRWYKRLVEKRKEYKKNKLARNNTGETLRSSGFFFFVQRSKNAKKDGKECFELKEQDSNEAEIDNQLINDEEKEGEDNDEEEEDCTPSPAPSDRRKRLRELFNESNHKCQSRLDCATSITEEEQGNTSGNFRHENSAGTMYFSLDDMLSSYDVRDGDEDDYLSLRFRTEEQREKSVMNLFPLSSDDGPPHGDFESCRNFHLGDGGGGAPH